MNAFSDVVTSGAAAQLAPDHGARPVVVLISAAWAGPSRPAPTALRELSRRWAGDVRTVLLEEPGSEAIDQLDISLVPTWIRLEPAHSHAAGQQGMLRDLEISGMAADGQDLILTGQWVETHRRTGALPKHVIDAEFGPQSR